MSSVSLAQGAAANGRSIYSSKIKAIHHGVAAAYSNAGDYISNHLTPSHANGRIVNLPDGKYIIARMHYDSNGTGSISALKYTAFVDDVKFLSSIDYGENVGAGALNNARGDKLIVNAHARDTDQGHMPGIYVEGTLKLKANISSGSVNVVYEIWELEE